jgi:hypothetical protein
VARLRGKVDAVVRGVRFPAVGTGRKKEEPHPWHRVPFGASLIKPRGGGRGVWKTSARAEAGSVPLLTVALWRVPSPESDGAGAVLAAGQHLTSPAPVWVRV